MELVNTAVFKQVVYSFRDRAAYPGGYWPITNESSVKASPQGAKFIQPEVVWLDP